MTGVTEQLNPADLFAAGAVGPRDDVLGVWCQWTARHWGPLDPPGPFANRVSRAVLDSPVEVVRLRVFRATDPEGWGYELSPADSCDETGKTAATDRSDR